jgi:hypothetical protein
MLNSYFVCGKVISAMQNYGFKKASGLAGPVSKHKTQTVD